MEHAVNATNRNSTSLHSDRSISYLYNLFDEVAFGVAVLLGPTLRVDYVNKHVLGLWNKKREEVIGKPLFEVVPETEAGARSIHEYVYERGERFSSNEISVELNTNGITETRWFNSIVDPLRDHNNNIIGQVATTFEVTEQVVARKKIEASEAALKKTRDQLQLSINAGHIGIWHWNVRQDELKWSGEQEEIYGLAKGTFGGKLQDFINFVHPHDVPKITDAHSSPHENSDREYQFRIIRKDGQLRWIQSRSRTSFNEEGELEYITGINVDLTDQKLAEQNLREDQKQLSNLANAMPQIVWIAESDGTVNYYNDRVQEFAGAKRLPDGNWSWEGVLHADDLQGTIDAWKKAVQERNVYEKEHRIQLVDGSYRWHLSRAYPQKDADGNVLKWYGTATDIHDLKTAEQKLKESDERFRTLVETLPQLVWITGVEGRRLYLSKQWKEYYGAELSDDFWSKMVHPDDWDGIMNQWKRSVQSGENLDYEVRLKNRHSEYRWFRTTGRAVRDANGNITQWTGVCTDIHEQKTIAENLEKQVELRTRELQRSNEDLQQFAHVASHDLKEPVRKVRTFGSMLRDEYGRMLPERAIRYLDKMEAAAQRMSAMIDGVLLYSSLDTFERTQQQVDLRHVISLIETDLEVLIEQKRGVIHCDKLPVVAGSEILLYQAFYNLVYNSLKFARQGISAEINITAEHAGRGEIKKLRLNTSRQYSRIVLTDNGIGFASEDAERIFQPFSRLHPKDKYEGTGLGLALCRKIIERHDGAIYAESRDGSGASFVILLPES
jgi:PAS domain S-box-containing protein